MASEGSETASESQTRGSQRGARGQPFWAFAEAAGARGAEVLRRRGPSLAAAAAALGGLLLLYAETLDLYRIVTPSGSISNAAGSVRTGSDQHSWALGVIGVAGAGACLLARADTPATPSAGRCDAGGDRARDGACLRSSGRDRVGVTTDLEVGDAEPAAGFWMELVGAIVMTAGAAALAWLLGRRQAARSGYGAGARP